MAGGMECFQLDPLAHDFGLAGRDMMRQSALVRGAQMDRDDGLADLFAGHCRRLVAKDGGGSSSNDTMYGAASNDILQGDANSDTL